MMNNFKILSVNQRYISQKLFDVLNNLPIDKSINFDFKLSKDGHLVPVYNNNALHSTYYPLKEGDKIADNFQLASDEVCIAIGFGAGYHLVKLAKTSQQIIVVCFVYPLIKSVLEKIDLSLFFEHNNLKLILAEEINDYFDYNRFNGYKFIIHKVFERLYPTKVLTILKKIKNILNPIIVEHNTQRKFAMLWFNNILRNVASLYNKKYDFSPLTITQRIVVVVGAGPSLEQNITLLHKYKKHFFIASADTSLKILLKHQIIPDVVFSFDAQHHSLLNFVGLRQKIRLFTDFTASLRDTFQQGLVFSNHPIRHLFEKCGWDIIALDSSSRNIGHSIIDFFRNYFPNIIILSVGIDYAFYKNSGYSKGSYLDEYKLNNSDYYNPIDKIDAKLFYQHNFVTLKDNWKTTMLFKTYASNSFVKNNIYTLSSSPFSPYKKIVSLDNFIFNNSAVINSVLNFNYPLLRKDTFIDIFIKTIEEYNIFDRKIIKFSNREIKDKLFALTK